jgi:hypothetical protein
MLGRGGLGIVYRAFYTRLDRTVMLHVLPASALACEHDWAPGVVFIAGAWEAARGRIAWRD